MMMNYDNFILSYLQIHILNNGAEDWLYIPFIYAKIEFDANLTMDELTKPSQQPIVVYKEGNFCNIVLETDLKKMIEDELKNNEYEWKDVVEIKITEEDCPL
jgi:hypothetical protein